MPGEEVVEAEEAGDQEGDQEEDQEEDLGIVAVDGDPVVVVTDMEDQDTTRDLMVVLHTEEAMADSADEGPQVQVALGLVR